MKPVPCLHGNHPRIVPVETTDGNRVIEIDAMIGYVDDGARDLPVFAQRVPDRRIECRMHRQILPVIRAFICARQPIREPRPVVHVA